jgi:hypothetical protein
MSKGFTASNSDGFKVREKKEIIKRLRFTGTTVYKMLLFTTSLINKAFEFIKKRFDFTVSISPVAPLRDSKKFYSSRVAPPS